MRWLVVTILLFGLCSGALAYQTASPPNTQELREDILVGQDDISLGTPLFTFIVTFNREETFTITATWRWFAENPQTTLGDRVALLRIDGRFLGPAVIQDSCSGCPWQTSASLVYTSRLPAGTHTFELLYGGCCGITGHPFYIGAGSRMEIIY